MITDISGTGSPINFVFDSIGLGAQLPIVSQRRWTTSTTGLYSYVINRYSARQAGTTWTIH